MDIILPERKYLHCLLITDDQDIVIYDGEDVKSTVGYISEFRTEIN